MTPCRHCSSTAPVPAGICDSCLGIACDMAVAYRVKFNKLLAAGVTRRMANDILIRQIDNERPS